MTLDEFRQVELRIGKITGAERVEKSEKLLKLQIDLGGESRQVVSGIAGAYAPDDLIGKEIVLVANLEPRTLMGLESQGMLLAAHGDDGKPVVLTVERPVAPGSQIT